MIKLLKPNLLSCCHTSFLSSILLSFPHQKTLGPYSLDCSRHRGVAVSLSNLDANRSRACPAIVLPAPWPFFGSDRRNSTFQKLDDIPREVTRIVSRLSENRHLHDSHRLDSLARRRSTTRFPPCWTPGNKPLTCTLDRAPRRAECYKVSGRSFPTTAVINGAL
jgi:hypothetical protein